MANLFLSDPNGRMSIDASTSLQDYCLPAGRRIEQLISQIVAIEFLAVATTCFLTSVVYFETVLTQWPSTAQYIASAVAIALLIVLVALSFKQYVAIQAQSRDRYMWSGIGTTLLAFSLFLSVLFLFKIADWYSRGTFFFQFFGASAAILIVRGTMHSRVRRAIQSGAVAARTAVIVGDMNGNGAVLENLKRFGIHSIGLLPFPLLPAGKVPNAAAPSTDSRNLVERCRRLKPDAI
jgi:hypothetical protein